MYLNIIQVIQRLILSTVFSTIVPGEGRRKVNRLPVLTCLLGSLHQGIQCLHVSPSHTTLCSDWCTKFCQLTSVSLISPPPLPNLVSQARPLPYLGREWRLQIRLNHLTSMTVYNFQQIILTHQHGHTLTVGI